MAKGVTNWQGSRKNKGITEENLDLCPRRILGPVAATLYPAPHAGVASNADKCLDVERISVSAAVAITDEAAADVAVTAAAAAAAGAAAAAVVAADAAPADTAAATADCCNALV